MTAYCKCGEPLFDPEHDAGCRRCGLPVDFTPSESLTCISCGSDNLVADYDYAYKQGITVWPLPAGSGFNDHGDPLVAGFDYDGTDESYDDGAGDNEAYRCVECHATARSVEALVGLDPHGRYERGAIVTMIDRLNRDVAELVRELASLPAGPPLVPESEVTPEQEAARAEAEDDDEPRDGPDEHDACAIHETAYRICGCAVPTGGE